MLVLRPITRLLLLFGLTAIIIGGATAWFSYLYVVDFDSKEIKDMNLSQSQLVDLRRNSDIAKNNVALSNIVFWLGIGISLTGGFCFMVDFQDSMFFPNDDNGGRKPFVYK